MIVISRVKRIGGSLMARIPSDAAKELNIKDNDEIQMDVSKKRKSYFGVFRDSKYSEFTEEDRLDSRI